MRSVVVGVRENAFQNTNTASSSFFFSIEVLKKYTNMEFKRSGTPLFEGTTNLDEVKVWVEEMKGHFCCDAMQCQEEA